METNSPTTAASRPALCTDDRCIPSHCPLAHTREFLAARERQFELEDNEMSGAELRAAWDARDGR